MDRLRHSLNKLFSSQALRISIFCAALVLVYLALSRRDWGLFFISQQELGVSYYEDNINDGGEELRKHLVGVQGGWLPTPYGLTLLPGTVGQLALQFHKEPQQGVLVNLWFYRAGGIKNAVMFATPNQTDVYENVDIRGNAFFDISQLTHGEDKFRIILRCSVPPDFPAGKTLLDKISISFIRNYHGSFPALSSFLACLFAGLLLLVILKRLGADDLKAWCCSFGIGLAFAILVAYRLMGFLPSIIFLSSVFCCYAILSYRKDKRLWQDNRMYLGLLFLLLALGLESRWTLLHNIWPLELDPDAQGYYSLAQGLSSLYDTGMREPLYIWLVRILCSLTAWSHLDLRFLTLLLSMGVIAATYWSGAQLFNRAVGVGAAAFVSFAAPFIRMSIRGLRFELFIIFLVILFTRALGKQDKKHWALGSVFDGLVAGLACLVRLNTIGIILLLWLYQGIRMKWNYKMAVIRIGLLLMLIAPHLYNNYRISQPPDPFFSTNIHAVYYRNQEFSGQPGFPSQEELAKNGYAGEPISFLAYVFNLHSLGQIVNRTILGMVSIFLGYYTKTVVFSNNLFFYILFIVGAIALLFSKKRMLLLFLIIMEIPQAFILSYPLTWSSVLEQHGGMDWRLAIHIAPFLSMIAFYAPFGWWEIFRHKVPTMVSRFRAEQENTGRKQPTK